MKAIWGHEYDWRKDEIYDCPVCPKCKEEVGKIKGKYICFACGQEVEIPEDMIDWLKIREETKTETTDCYRCGGKDCLESHYMRNPVSLEWQLMNSVCKSCGMKVIV